MKTKKLLLTVGALLLINLLTATTAFAKNSSCYKLAEKEFKMGNYDEGMALLYQEVKENPENGYAHLEIAVAESIRGENEKALSSANLAIRFLPPNNRKSIANAYATRADIYLAKEDTISALSDFKMATTANPKDVNLWDRYGQLLFECKHYDESDMAYFKIQTLKPSALEGYLGVGRNLRAQGKYDEAFKQYDIALKKNNKFSLIYVLRAECYIKLGQYQEALIDFVKALSIDKNDIAFSYLVNMPEELLPSAVEQLTDLASKNPKDAYWWYCMSEFYLNNLQYKEAIDVANKAYKIDQHKIFPTIISECYKGLGDYPKAIEAINRAIEIDPDDMELIATKADLLSDSGKAVEAIEELTKLIELEPSNAGLYYMRGFIEDNDNRTDAALMDYNMVISLMPEYAYSYLGKGDMLMRKGQREEALSAYRKVLELDTVPENNSCAMYALLALGEKDKAVDFMNRVIENDPDDCGNYYDAACFYSRMGDLDKSLTNLRIAFEKGYRRFYHVKTDDDLEALRQTEGFKDLINEYVNKKTI